MSLRKGARLYLRTPAKGNPYYVIRDSGRPDVSTRTGDLAEAETALAAYIAERDRPQHVREPDEISIAEVLTVYATDRGVDMAAPLTLAFSIQALLPFWGRLKASEVGGPNCRRYAEKRGRKPGTIRRELGVLQAALNHAAVEKHIARAPRVKLPPMPETTQRAMTRSEAARLLHVARRLGYHHVARFIVVSLYTGTRASPALALALYGPQDHCGWFDLESGVLYRRGPKEAVTKKRRTPIRIPRQLRAHVTNWRNLGLTFACEWRGMRVGSVKTAWHKIVETADLGWNPTPHTLKHTAITWAIRDGVALADAAAYFATSTQTIERVYWHLSPHFQTGALDAIERRRK